MFGRPDPMDRLTRARSSFWEAQRSFEVARRELLDAERQFRDDSEASRTMTRPRVA